MKKILTALVLSTLASSGWAVSFDANVTPGVYYGSGNANGGWTVDTANGIELGLRTHQRYPSPANIFNSGGDGTYAWADTTGYNGAENRSSWNYDFSINVAGTSDTIGDFVFKLYIDSDPGAGQTWTVFDPKLIPDNANPSAPYGPSDLGSQYAQNSENVRWPLVGIPGYDNTIAGSYDFALQAYNSSGDLQAQTHMRVNVNGGTASGAFDGNVPDAGSSVALLGIALASLGTFSRRLRR